MSKLFDQLKKAARSRDERSPGLLLEALEKAKSASSVAPESPVASAPPVAPAQASAPSGPADSVSSHKAHPYAGIAVAIAIFAVVVVAWHASPWRAPQHLKIDPTDLKLDRNLDLQRPSPKAAASPSHPS